jgi:hypothetical protein
MRHDHVQVGRQGEHQGHVGDVFHGAAPVQKLAFTPSCRARPGMG